MNKTALITGSTDGIGQATAFELAKKGWTIHVLGRNQARGEETLRHLQELHPTGEHKLFLVDLASIQRCKQFLEEYTKEYEQLDLLLLNALALKKGTLTEDGIDTIFAVGCVSRYIFSIELSPLLLRAEGRVMHIGNAERLSSIDYEAVVSDKLGILKATSVSYAGSALLAYHLAQLQKTQVPHEIMWPGNVRTKQFPGSSFLPKFIFRLLGVLEPEESGRRIAEHITSTTASEVSGKFYDTGKEKSIHKQILTGQDTFEELVRFCEQKTGMTLSEMV